MSMRDFRNNIEYATRKIIDKNIFNLSQVREKVVEIVHSDSVGPYAISQRAPKIPKLTYTSLRLSFGVEKIIII